MAHFAEIDQNNIVTRVVVVDDAHEANGVSWCKRFFGGGDWVQTSYNASIRKNFAGVGFAYDAEKDAFIPPRPYPSWSLNEATCKWEAPSTRPSDGNVHEWDEAARRWFMVRDL